MQSAGPHHYPAGGPAIRHAELDSILSLAGSKKKITHHITTTTIYSPQLEERRDIIFDISTSRINKNREPYRPLA